MKAERRQFGAAVDRAGGIRGAVQDQQARAGTQRASQLLIRAQMKFMKYEKALTPLIEMVSAAGIASKGFKTVCYDADSALVAELKAGRLPVFEPQLDDLVRDNSARLTFSAAIGDLGPCDVVYVAPDIPTDAEGRSDVAVIHAQKADRQGNVLIDGIVGVQKEVVLGSKRSIVTVEEIVDDFGPRSPNAVILPSWTVGAIAVVPGGAYPSYTFGYYKRDNAFYKQWDVIARERDSFTAWMDRHIRQTTDFDGFRRSLEQAAAK